MVLILSNCTLDRLATVANNPTHPMGLAITGAAYLSSEQVRRPNLPPGKRPAGLTTSRGVAQRPERRELTYGHRRPEGTDLRMQVPPEPYPHLPRSEVPGAFAPYGLGWYY